MSGICESIEALRRTARKQPDPGSAMLQFGLSLVNGQMGGEGAVYAAEFFREAAETYGSADAMYELGMCYRWGDGGVYADPEDAVFWFKKAAEKGHAKAKTVAAQFDTDQGRAILLMSAMNSAEGQGARWYRTRIGMDYYYEQAKAGNAESQYELARQLADPSHFGPFRYNITEAISWYTKAAEQGVVDAMFNLGQLYKAGAPGLEPDRDRAKQWFLRCAEAGDAEAKQIIEAWKE